MNSIAVSQELTEPQPQGFLGILTTVDHKRIGLMYMLTAGGFLLLAGALSIVMRLQLAQPNSKVVGPDAFNQLLTLHGTSMIFLVGMPLLVGFANYLVPLMIGARDVAFPRLNAFAFWLVPAGGLLLYMSVLAGGAPAIGWFSYAPLSEPPYSLGVGVDYWIMSLVLLGVGSVAGSANIIATILCLRAPGMTLGRLPLFVWMMLITMILTALALPALNAATIMLFVDRMLDAAFFLPQRGGSAIVWQHFFWVFGHPEVYILALPAFGIISEVVPVFSGRPIVGHTFVALSTVAIGLLSFGVWAHHMFAVGLGHEADLAFSAASLLIAVPTGVKVFNWAVTMVTGHVRLTTAMLFAMGFLIEFVIGGLSGVTLAVVPIDWQVTDSYYVVAHFHYVLFGGTVFGVLAGVYYWFPKMTGRLLDERLGRIHFWLSVIGFNATFFVMHLLGMMGMPRRVYTYPDLPGWGSLNMVATLGAVVLSVAFLVLIYNIVRSLRHGQLAGDNPWGAWSLEWATSSPPLAHNFDEIPRVFGRQPLLDTGAADREVAKTLRIPKSSVLIFAVIASESVFFIMLLVAYVTYNVDLFGSGPGPLDIGRTGVFSVALFASSATLVMAERALRRNTGPDSFRRAMLWIGATLALGSIFLLGQATEYLSLIDRSIVPSDSTFAACFFSITGFHGLHVLVGLIAIGVWSWLYRAQTTVNAQSSLAVVGRYWHFVDAVWVVVFSLLYLGRIL